MFTSAMNTTSQYTFIGTTPKNSTSSSGHREAYATATPRMEADAPTSTLVPPCSAACSAHPPTPHHR